MILTLLALALIQTPQAPVVDVQWVPQEQGWTPTCPKGQTVVRFKGTPLTEHTMDWKPECQFSGTVLHKGSMGEYQCIAKPAVPACAQPKPR